MRGVSRPDLLVFDSAWPPASISWRPTRRLSLKLSSDGTPKVSAPLFARPRDVELFIKNKLPWLNKQRLQLSEAYESLSKEWLGQGIGIVHSTGQLSAGNGLNRLELQHPVDFLDWHLLYPLARPHIRDLLNKQAKIILPSLVAVLECDSGNKASDVQIRFMRSRWGSCNHLGKITLNSQLIRLSNELIEYVIIHELAHVRHHHHGQAFWREVEKNCRDYALLRRRLKQVRLFD